MYRLVCVVDLAISFFFLHCATVCDAGLAIPHTPPWISLSTARTIPPPCRSSCRCAKAALCLHSLLERLALSLLAIVPAKLFSHCLLFGVSSIHLHHNHLHHQHPPTSTHHLPTTYPPLHTQHPTPTHHYLPNHHHPSLSIFNKTAETCRLGG